MIRKVGGRYVLYSRKTGRRLGDHATRRDAERQEKAIELSKLRRQGRIPPRKTMAKRRRRRARENPVVEAAGGELVLWVLGLTAVTGAAVAAVAVAANSASSGASNPNPCPALPAGQTVSQQQYSANYAQTGTTMALQVGDTVTIKLLRGANNAWQFGAGDDTILSMGTPTTQADTTFPAATDDVCVFTAVGQGSTTISATGGGTGTSATTPQGVSQGQGQGYGQRGQNTRGNQGGGQTASGSGTFNLTINVNCPGNTQQSGFPGSYQASNQGYQQGQNGQQGYQGQNGQNGQNGQGNQQGGQAGV